LHSGIEETGSPGIIYIVFHQDLHHPSQHGTSSMGKHWLAKADIAKLNELTQLEGSESTTTMVDDRALAMLKRQGSRGNTIVSVQRKLKRLHFDCIYIYKIDRQNTPNWQLRTF